MTKIKNVLIMHNFSINLLLTLLYVSILYNIESERLKKAKTLKLLSIWNVSLLTNIKINLWRTNYEYQVREKFCVIQKTKTWVVRHVNKQGKYPIQPRNMKGKI